MPPLPPCHAVAAAIRLLTMPSLICQREDIADAAAMPHISRRRHDITMIAAAMLLRLIDAIDAFRHIFHLMPAPPAAFSPADAAIIAERYDLCRISPLFYCFRYIRAMPELKIYAIFFNVVV